MMRLGRAEQEKWVAGLKVGDKVAREEGGYGRPAAIYEIVRMSGATLWAKQNGYDYELKIRRSDGKVIGAGPFDYVEPVTNEILAAIKRDRLLGRIQATVWSKVPTDQLERIDRVLKGEPVISIPPVEEKPSDLLSSAGGPGNPQSRLEVHGAKPSEIRKP